MPNRNTLAFFLLFGVCALYIFNTLFFLPHFFKLRKYLKMEIRRSDTREEKKHWKRELRKLRLCFLPLITINNVDTIFRFFRRRR